MTVTLLASPYCGGEGSQEIGMGRFRDWLKDILRLQGSSPDAEYVNVSSSDAPSSEATPTAKRSWLTRWTPGAQRERQIAWLQAGYSEMLNLMRGIHAHLERQEDVQHKLVAALEQLPASLENLKSLGKAAEHQVEVLALLRDQLARSTQHDQHLVDSMNRFNETLGLLDETARASGRTVEQLVQKAREKDQLLHEMIRHSEKRSMLLVSLFVLVLVAFLVVGGYFMMRLRGAIPPPATLPPAATELTSRQIPASSLPTDSSERVLESPADLASNTSATEPAPQEPTLTAAASTRGRSEQGTVEEKTIAQPAAPGESDAPAITKPAQKKLRPFFRRRRKEPTPSLEVSPATETEEGSLP